MSLQGKIEGFPEKLKIATTVSEILQPVYKVWKKFTEDLKILYLFMHKIYKKTQQRLHHDNRPYRN